jgi:hypothetical protein
MPLPGDKVQLERYMLIFKGLDILSSPQKCFLLEGDERVISGIASREYNEASISCNQISPTLISVPVEILLWK